jgi:hypothetical protein
MSSALRRAREVMTSPPALLISAFVTGLATLGLSIPVEYGVPIGIVTLLSAGVVGALQGPGEREDQLAPGTAQRELVSRVEQTVERIRRLQESDISPAVSTPAVEALSAGTSALATARTVARAVDGFDSAIADLHGVGRHHTGQVARLQARRVALLDRLNSTAGTLIEVYANLVETNATVKAGGVVDLGVDQQLESVTASLGELRGIVDQLDHDARAELA